MHFVYPPPAELQRLGEASLAEFVRSATAPRTLDDAELRTVLDTVLLDGVPLSIALEEAAETFRKRRRAVTRRRAAPAAPLADPRLDMLEQQVRALAAALANIHVLVEARLGALEDRLKMTEASVGKATAAAAAAAHAVATHARADGFAADVATDAARRAFFADPDAAADPGCTEPRRLP